MKVRIVSNKNWNNTHVFINDEDVSKEIQAIMINILVGEISTINIALKGEDKTLQFYSPSLDLKIDDAQEILR